MGKTATLENRVSAVTFSIKAPQRFSARKVELRPYKNSLMTVDLKLTPTLKKVCF